MTVIGMAVVAIGLATRSIGWGIAEAEVNMKICLFGTARATGALAGVVTTFLSPLAATADAQNARATNAAAHRPTQPIRRDSLGGVFIKEVWAQLR